jgi:hypothetical protein
VRVEFGVDGGKECGQLACSWPGGHDAVLVVAELGPDQVQVAVGLMLVDLGQQFRLGAAWAGCVSLGRGHRHVLEVDLGREQASWSVGQFDRQRSAQHSWCHRVVGDGCEPEPLPCRAVHPVAEPPVADLEGEPSEQRCAVGGVVVELLSEFDGSKDRFDDDPFIIATTERLSLDDLAGQAVAEQTGTEFLGRASGADLEFHDLAGAHA